MATVEVTKLYKYTLNNNSGYCAATFQLSPIFIESDWSGLKGYPTIYAERCLFDKAREIGMSLVSEPAHAEIPANALRVTVNVKGTDGKFLGSPSFEGFPEVLQEKQ
jgi:hypothetical protein